MNNETILIRIKKLLALADSPNEHEAAQAAARAQDLLTKHNLALADLEGIDPARREHVEQTEWNDLVYPSNKVAGWREDLFISVANTTYCKGWFTEGYIKDAEGRSYFYDRIGRLRYRKQRKAVIIGRPSDVEVAKYLFTYLTRRLASLADEYAWANADRSERGDINRQRSGFLKGATAIVTMRLYKEWKQRKEDVQAVNAMVVVRDHELVDWMKDAGIALVPSKNWRTGADADAFNAGAAAGRSIGLNRGIEGGAGRKQLDG